MIILSNNQWKWDYNNEEWAAKGLDCSPAARAPGLVRAYRQILPDVMGLQEVSTRMANLVMGSLAEVALPDGSTARYEYISGGDTPIVYRRDRLKLLESGFFLYDEAVPGLEGSFNNGETKSWCYGVFEDRATGKRFALMSTHLWWMSSHPEDGRRYRAGSNKARAYQIGLASARMDDVMARYGCPGFIVGDLNASVHSLCLEAAFREGWREIHDLAPAADRDETRGHHPCGPHGFERGEPGSFEQAIDHILLKNGDGVRVRCFRRLTDEWFDSISDHYPLYTEVAL